MVQSATNKLFVQSSRLYVYLGMCQLAIVHMCFKSCVAINRLHNHIHAIVWMYNIHIILSHVIAVPD